MWGKGPTVSQLVRGRVGIKSKSKPLHWPLWATAFLSKAVWRKEEHFRDIWVLFKSETLCFKKSTSILLGRFPRKEFYLWFSNSPFPLLFKSTRKSESHQGSLGTPMSWFRGPPGSQLLLSQPGGVCVTCIRPSAWRMQRPQLAVGFSHQQANNYGEKWLWRKEMRNGQSRNTHFIHGVLEKTYHSKRRG